MANHMAEIAKILGVELGEEFTVSEYSSRKYKITASGIEVFRDDLWRSGVVTASFVLEKLLAGTYSIERNPWKPKRDEPYWYVDENGAVWKMDWYVCGYPLDHMNRYKLGNCYRTCEEAEANKDKWIKFYASDEVLEV